VEDGVILAQNNTAWADAQAGTAAVADISSSEGDAIAFESFFSNICAVIFINFDTSSIPDANEITSARLKLYSSEQSDVGDLSSDTLEVRVYNWGETDWPAARRVSRGRVMDGHGPG
jgi:hypothetical protein